MTVWTWVLGETPPSGVRLRELTKAHGRSATWRLDANATAQFSIKGTSDEAAVIVPLATDLTCYRDGVKMFRGRIGPESDDISPTNHACQFTATDYRGMLGYRITGAAGAAYTSTAAGAIALGLVTTSQALAGGNWGVTAGVGTATGTSRDKTIDPGKPVVESINELGRLDAGFEWEVDAELALNLWHPRRGSVNGVVLDYGGVLNRVQRLLDPKDFANAALATGGQGLAPVMSATAGIGTDPRGRWETSGSFPTITDQNTLNARAPWLRDQASTLRPTYTVQFRPGRWKGKTHVWLGDTVTLVVKKGRLNIAGSFRVIEVSVQPGDNGTEVVNMGLLAA